MSRRIRPRRRPAPRPPGPFRTLAGILIGSFLFTVVVGGWVVWTYAGPGPAARSGPATTVILPHGAGVGRIAHLLRDAGVIASSQAFVLAARLGGSAQSLKAGEYAVPSGASMARLLDDIRHGRVVRHYVTIPEGWTSEMAVEALGRQPVLTGAAAVPPEGSLLPDTYQVERGESREAVIGRIRRARDQLLAKLWAQRRADLPLETPEQAVTLASIVEKETAVPAERPRIAAVYVNRLIQGMRLESDPTVIYGVSGGRPLGRGISADELAAKTPYNTYQVAGLPPTPIANPGKASLAAVLDPPRTSELFFVADGTGGHAFAATYDEHLRNVARWRRVERTALEASR